MKFILIILASATAFAQCPTVVNGVCVTGLSAVQNNLLGPLIPFGASPWPYGDAAEKGVADNQAPAALAEAPVLGAALSGTVSWTQGSNIIATTADLTGVLSGINWVALAWNSVDGNGTGRALCNIGSVTSTTITCQGGNIFAPTSSGIKAYIMSDTPDTHGWTFQSWTNGNPTLSWNYYDNAIAYYRLYYRTNNSQYQTWARAYADIQWQWVIDHGYNPVYPRAASMISQFFRAGEGHSERLPGLYNYIAQISPLWNPSGCPNCDNREDGYATWYNALGAKVDTDPTRHAAYCSTLATYTNTWNTVQQGDGSFGENEYGNNPSYVAAPKTFSAPFFWEGSPWRIAINVKSLEAAYESLNDTSGQGCNNPTLAATTLTHITSAVSWQWNYGRDSANRGVFYNVNSQSEDQQTVYPGTGTASATLTSTAVTGSGTNWKTAGYCDGTHFIGFQAPRSIYKIGSCADDTHAVLTVAFGLYGEMSNDTNDAIAFAPAASNSCNSSATYCFGGVAPPPYNTGDRNLERTLAGGTGWLYNQTLNSTYLAWTNELLSAQLGGPAAGLTYLDNIGTNVLPCAGAACDGFVTDTVASAPNCTDTSNVPPCVPGSYLYGNLGKNFGEAFGAPGIDNALAWRLVSSSSVPPVITNTSPLPNCTVGTPCSYQFTAAGTTPISWTATGVPSWAAFGTGGLLNGTPTTATSYTINVKATNAVGSAGPTPFTLLVSPAITCAPATHAVPPALPGATDVQLQVNMGLGVVACTNSLTGSGCSVVDVQRVVNAALGGACVVGP